MERHENEIYLLFTDRLATITILHLVSFVSLKENPHPLTNLL
jgi:hypothetical protein